MSRLGKNMIHVGTFCGDILPNFARVMQGRIFGFEPVFENYILAKICMEENQLDNVFLLNSALGSTLEVAHVQTHDADETHRGSANHISEAGQALAMVTVDSLGLRQVSLIPLDVEGYVLQALKGAGKTLSREGPIVMIEDNSNNCRAYLEQLNYHYSGAIPGLSIWCCAHHRQFLECQPSVKNIT